MFPQAAPQQVQPGPAPGGMPGVTDPAAAANPMGEGGGQALLQQLIPAISNLVGQQVTPDTVQAMMQAADMGDQTATTILQQAMQQLTSSGAVPQRSGMAEMQDPSVGATLG